MICRTIQAKLDAISIAGVLVQSVWRDAEMVTSASYENSTIQLTTSSFTIAIKEAFGSKCSQGIHK
jgi:hypothetical protein